MCMDIVDACRGKDGASAQALQLSNGCSRRLSMPASPRARLWNWANMSASWNCFLLVAFLASMRERVDGAA